MGQDEEPTRVWWTLLDFQGHSGRLGERVGDMFSSENTVVVLIYCCF